MDKVMVRMFFLTGMGLTFLAIVICVGILMVCDLLLVQVLTALLIFTLSILFIGMYGYLQLTKPQKENVPYWMRNGMEDVIAPNASMRVMLRNVQDFIDRAEWDLERQADIVGQIRAGVYDKDQPRAPRPPTNGDSK